MINLKKENIRKNEISLLDCQVELILRSLEFYAYTYHFIYPRKRESETDEDKYLNAIGTLEIPSINFKDIVVEGTDQAALAQGIGLFEHSNILEGNVCLAGHNTYRFLANLKNVQEGDIIKYSSALGNKEYKITTIKQIQETDWSMLQDTEDNRITIITCVRNKPELRLCVQAIENI